MAALTMNVEHHGFRELQHKVKGAMERGGFIAEPWGDAAEAIGVLGENGVISTAPLRSGHTISKISFKVHKAVMPRYVVVKTTAKRGQFSYPRFTNYSPYASRIRPATKSGGLRRAAPNPNKGWFERGLLRIWPAVPRILANAANAMERRWAA